MEKDQEKEIEKKMEVIRRVDRKYLIDVLFKGKNPFSDPKISIDEICQKCLEALTAEVLLSAD